MVGATARVVLLGLALARIGPALAEERAALSLSARVGAAPGTDTRLRASPDLVLQPVMRGGKVVEPAGSTLSRSQCPVEWCQPAVEVPGMDLPRPRPSRSELFAAVLDEAGIEPLASMVWLLVRTGVAIDWRPAALDTSGSGRGSVVLWWKVRMDAHGRPSLPTRGPVGDRSSG